MSKLKLGELFAGYGGLGMAVEQVFDAELTWYAEWDDAPSKIMAHHWPGIPNHRDVTAVDWSQVEPVDIISGGSPCQDLSAAGRRAGMTAGTRSNLWVSMREAIATIKPKYVVWENVRGAYSAKATSEVEHCAGCMGEDGGATQRHLRALGRVLGDLSDLGYDAEWRGVTASEVGAPHNRYRVFLLATRRSNTIQDTNGERSGRGHDAPGESTQRGQDSSPSIATSGIGQPRATSTNNNLQRCEELKQPASRTETQVTAPNSGIDTLSRTNWGAYDTAVKWWESVFRPAPKPTEVRPNGRHRLSVEFPEWMMGLNAGHVADVEGITHNQKIKALGNGVQIQQAKHALADMLRASEEY